MGTTPVLRSVVYSANRPFSRPTCIAHLPGRAWAPARPSGCMNTGADIAGDADARMPCRRQARAGQHPAAARSPWRASCRMVQAPRLLHAAEIPPCEASVLYHQPACEVKRPLLAQTGSPAPRAGIGTTDAGDGRGWEGGTPPDSLSRAPSLPSDTTPTPWKESCCLAPAEAPEGIGHCSLGFPNSGNASWPSIWEPQREGHPTAPNAPRKP